MTPFERLEQCARGWRRHGRDRATFCCDAHDDNRPSVAARELDDGRVLLHCFAGCDVAAVVGAMGLTMESLFPNRISAHHIPSPRRRSILTAAQALDLIAFESMLTWTAASNISNGHSLTSDDLLRLGLASQRIQAVYVDVRQ